MGESRQFDVHDEKLAKKEKEMMELYVFIEELFERYQNTVLKK